MTLYSLLLFIFLFFTAFFFFLVAFYAHWRAGRDSGIDAPPAPGRRSGAQVPLDSSSRNATNGVEAVVRPHLETAPPFMNVSAAARL